MSYTVTYSQLSTKLLNHKFDTNCFDYDLDYKFHNNNMKSDCLTWCYQKKLNEEHNLKHQHESRYFFPTESLFRKEALTLIQNVSIAKESYHSIRNSIQKNNKFCHDECRKDCSFIYYSPDYKGDELGVYTNDVVNFTEIDITIVHSNLPDIFITYLPKISFLSLVCDFGGLMGMWLGLSLLQIMEYSNYLAKILKRKSIHLFSI